MNTVREKRCFGCLEPGHQKRLYKTHATPDGVRNSHTQTGKLSHSNSGGHSVSISNQTLKLDDDMVSVYEECCKSAHYGCILIC